eukprot:UN00253
MYNYWCTGTIFSREFMMSAPIISRINFRSRINHLLLI